MPMNQVHTNQRRNIIRRPDPSRGTRGGLRFVARSWFQSSPSNTGTTNYGRTIPAKLWDEYKEPWPGCRESLGVWVAWVKKPSKRYRISAFGGIFGGTGAVLEVYESPVESYS